MGGGGRRILLRENSSCLLTGPQTFPTAYRDLPSFTTLSGPRIPFCRERCGGKDFSPSSLAPRVPRAVRGEGQAGCRLRCAERCGRWAGAELRWTAPQRGRSGPAARQVPGVPCGTGDLPSGLTTNLSPSSRTVIIATAAAVIGGAVSASTVWWHAMSKKRTSGGQGASICTSAKTFLSVWGEIRSEMCLFKTNIVN